MHPSLHRASDRRIRIPSTLLRIAAAFVLFGTGAQSASAQQATAEPGWQFLVTPYLWVTSVTLTTKLPRPNLPDITSHVDFDELLTHMSWVPFMGSVEARNGPFGVFVDYMHAPIRAGITTRNDLFNSGSSTVAMNIATVDFLYRIVETPQQRLDAGIGVRPWGIATTLSLNAGRLPATKLSQGASWADPLLIARYHHELGSGFGLSVYGDFGGFGLAAHTDWQVVGTIDYAIDPGIDVHVGYRSLNVNYSTGDGRGFNADMKGPLIAATFRF